MMIDRSTLLMLNEKNILKKQKKNFDERQIIFFLNFEYSWLYCLKYKILETDNFTIITFNIFITFTI